MIAVRKSLRLHRETIRRLDQSDLQAAVGGSLLETVTATIRRTIETVLSADTACASSCLTDPPTCLCPTFGCADSGG